MFLKYISLKIFLTSLALGLLYVYLFNPDPTIIYVYPTPDNVGQVEYIDKADNCFQFAAIQTNCSASKTAIKTIPIQK
jgi:hypothetical protein